MAIFSKETFSLLSLLSLNRLFNFIKVWWGFFFSVLLKKTIVKGLPYAISIEPNSGCNLRCPECPTGNHTLTRSSGKMEIVQFNKIIDDIYKKTFYLNLFFQGEPFMHPNFSELALYAVKKKMFVCISTNGHFLNKENCIKIVQSGLQKIIISLDGATADTYNKYRTGGDFNNVTTGIGCLAKTKTKLNSSFPQIVIQMLVNKYNEHEIKEMEKLSQKLGANKLELKTMQLEQRADFLPEKSKLKRYIKTADGKLILNRPLRNRCKRLWTTAVITWEGNLASCCYDKNAEYGHGNIFNTPLSTLWKSKEMNLFRKRILTNRKEIDICSNCNE